MDLLDSAPRNAWNKSYSIRLTEFEGIRGLLAAWVIFGHILLFSGYTYRDGLFGILFSPVLGVYVFMMLSGFVITYALDTRHVDWFAFMKRRFFRIYPIYALSIALAIASLGISQRVAEHFAPQHFAAENAERLAEVSQHFALYVGADALLLQTLLPRPIFPHAHETFLPPTWSLSLEWLFYLAMPFVLCLLRQSWPKRAFGLAAIAVVIALLHDKVAVVSPSLCLANGSYFLCGIISYYVWRHLPEARGKYRWPALIAFWLVLGLGFASLGLSYKIWLGIMALLLYRRVHPKPIRVLEWNRWLLTTPPLQFLGRVSYSSYLLHWIVIENSLFLGISLFPQWEGRFELAIFCCLTAFPLTYAASHLAYKYIERPCIDLGTRSLRHASAGIQRAPA